MSDLTYNGLQAAAKALTTKVARTSEAIRSEAKAIDEEAKATARDAESIGAMRVDKATVAETHELSKIMAGLSQAVITHAAAATDTGKQAKAVHTQNQASHGQIHEAMGRSPVGPDVYNVDRRWVNPE